MTVTLHDVVALFASRDFWVNFLGNLGGALVGVWLAFWIERRRSRRDADRLYGHMLVSARSELAYLRPICVSIRDRLKAGGNATRESFRVPATMIGKRAAYGCPAARADSRCSRVFRSSSSRLRATASARSTMWPAARRNFTPRSRR